jgi:hypothetical protein
MTKPKFITESELAALAKKMREAAGLRKIDVARKLEVAPPAIYNAEERPDLSLHKLRIRMIETLSDYQVVGPVYYLKRK